MSGRYYNQQNLQAESYWERLGFSSRWWRIYSSDPHWPRPYYPRLRAELEPSRNPHLARLSPRYLYSEAIGRPSEPTRRMTSDISQEVFFSYPYLEVPVSTWLGLLDPRRSDRLAYLGLWRCENDLEVLEHSLDAAAQAMREQGGRGLLGPVGISPHLGSGVLVDHWSDAPPLHAAYNPPYLAELAALALAPAGQARFYRLSLAGVEMGIPQPDVVPLEPARLAGDLLPLLAACAPTWGRFPPPDAAEAAFLLRWVGDGPLHGCLLLQGGQPAAFALLQPDFGPALQRWGGGRRLLSRPALRWEMLRTRRPGRARRARLLFGGVQPQLRGRGLGRRLLQAVIQLAAAHGWQSLDIGPLTIDSPAVSLLQSGGAQPWHTVALYELQLG